MTDREKLIEVVSDAELPIKSDGRIIAWYALEFDEALYMADHLISNGVTIPVHCKDCKHWEKTGSGCGWCRRGKVADSMTTSAITEKEKMARFRITCCKDCQKRSPECHGSCEEYKTQRAELDETNAETRKKYEAQKALDGFLFGNIERTNKRLNRKGR